MLATLAAKRSVDASAASPPYRFRKTAPRMAGGMAARMIKTSFQSFEKSRIDATPPMKTGLNRSFINMTTASGKRTVFNLGILNISPTERMAMGVSADARTLHS